MTSRAILRVWFVLLAALSLLCGADATTVLPTVEKCPVCAQRFVGSAFGSWFQFDEPNRDLSGSLFAAAGIETCPHCLYSALHFEPIAREERKRVAAVLAELPQELEAISRKENPASKIESGSTFRIATLCNAALNPDPRRDARLALVLYYGSVEGTRKTAAARRAAGALAKWLAADSTANHRADLVYLMGELQRRAGRTREAQVTFKRAAQIASAAGESSIADWASEQRKLAQRGITKANDREQSSGDYHDGAIRKLRPRLEEFIAALKRGEPSRKWLLPSKQRDAVHDTLGAANKLAQDKDLQAIEYVARWLAQLDESEIDDYPAPYCFEALAKHPKLAAPIISNLKFRYPPIEAASRYAAGLAPAPERTSAALAGKEPWNPTDTGTLKIAARRRDPAFKSLLLSRAVNPKRWPSDAESYLRAVCTADDIPALETRIRKIRLPSNPRDFSDPITQRQDLESVLLTVRLRHLARQIPAQ